MDMSTRVLAAGCAISSNFMIVAPSLEIVTLLDVERSLSIPRGPSVVFTTSATAWQALILDTTWALPYFFLKRWWKQNGYGCGVVWCAVWCY